MHFIYFLKLTLLKLTSLFYQLCSSKTDITEIDIALLSIMLIKTDITEIDIALLSFAHPFLLYCSNATGGTKMLNSVINIVIKIMAMKAILVIFPLVKVIKWAMSGAVLAIMMPQSSFSCWG